MNVTLYYILIFSTNRSNYNPDKNPETPENMKIGPDPPRDSMPIFYPYIYRILLEVSSWIVFVCNFLFHHCLFAYLLS